jgi:hypothetical protein
MKTKLIVGLLASLITTGALAADGAPLLLREVNTWGAMEGEIPSVYNTFDSHDVMMRVQNVCARDEGGFSEMGSSRYQPSVRVDETCSQEGSCRGEVVVPNFRVVRFNIGC